MYPAASKAGTCRVARQIPNPENAIIAARPIPTKTKETFFTISNYPPIYGRRPGSVNPPYGAAMSRRLLCTRSRSWVQTFPATARNRGAPSPQRCNPPAHSLLYSAPVYHIDFSIARKNAKYLLFCLNLVRLPHFLVMTTRNMAQ